jgi:hypothetical protein
MAGGVVVIAMNQLNLAYVRPNPKTTPVAIGDDCGHSAIGSTLGSFLATVMCRLGSVVTGIFRSSCLRMDSTFRSCWIIS